jgi:hypothetical protein
MPKKKIPDKNFKWTANLAYSVGLLTTDGCLMKDSRHIAMRSSDLSQLRNFKKCLNLTNKIRQTKHDGWAKNPTYRLQFGDVQFYRWLLKIGLFPNKTYTLGELKIPDKYFKDFVRGHLDDDGCISTYKDKYNTFKNPKYVYTRLWTRFTSASENHIRWLHKRIIKLIPIRGHINEEKISRSYQTTTMWTLKFGKNDSLKLLSWIYYKPNIYCLRRKRKIAEKFIGKRR